jgi:hypothetical protein
MTLPDSRVHDEGVDYYNEHLNVVRMLIERAVDMVAQNIFR